MTRRLIIALLSAAFAAAAVSCSSSGSVTASADQMDYQAKGVAFKMAEVPAGAYTRGLTRAMRAVSGENIALEQVEGYAISLQPVSSALWAAVMGGSASDGYADRMTRKDALSFVSKLSRMTGQDFRLPTESQLEYAIRNGIGTYPKDWRFWTSDTAGDAKELARDEASRYEYAPGTKAGALGVVVVFPNSKPVPESVLATLEGKLVKEQGERKNETIEVGGVQFDMKLIPAGTFVMGGTSQDQGQYAKEDELPVHEVNLDAFELGETEVTVALWNAVMGSLPTGNYIKEADKPVINVSWYEAQFFIQRLNSMTGRLFRLPTEAEWEYAAREAKTANYRYSGSNNATSAAVHGDENGGGVHPVKTRSQNMLGLYDMSGNAWEWCLDWYGPYSSATVTNPTGPAEGEMKVMRGGSVQSRWNACRVSNRSSVPPVNFKSTFGLRLAL